MNPSFAELSSSPPGMSTSPNGTRSVLLKRGIPARAPVPVAATTSTTVRPPSPYNSTQFLMKVHEQEAQKRGEDLSAMDFDGFQYGSMAISGGGESPLPDHRRIS